MTEEERLKCLAHGHLSDDSGRKLVNAVFHWLNFQFLCDREALFSQAYLATPIGEFLIADAVGSIIELEFPHHELQTPGPGCPRKIDFVARDIDTEELTWAIELKFLRSGNFRRQAIIDDVSRLAVLVKSQDAPIRKFFLLVGFTDVGEGDQWSNAMNFLTSVLSPIGSGFKIRTQGDHEDLFRNFSSGYQTDLLPDEIVSDLVEFKEDETFPIGLWRIRGLENDF